MKGYRLVSPEAYTGNPFTVIGKEWLIVAAGTPEQIRANPESRTGRFL